MAAHGAVVDVVDGPVEAPAKLSLEILFIIKAAQAQNGLRHGNFQRYRHYLTRKGRRIRKSIKLQHGKGRFVNKELNRETVTDSRHLLLILTKAERAWAHAMERKEETTARSRLHVHRLFHKASKWADLLQEVAHSVSDDRTVLEAEAYAAWMKGTTLFERDDWQLASDNFVRAQFIYDQLSKVVHAEQQSVYKQRLDEIDPQIRYCKYSMGDATSGQSREHMLELRQQMQDPSLDLLRGKMDGLLSDWREEQAKKMDAVEFCQKTISIPSESVRICILRSQETVVEMSQLRDKSSSERLSLYDKLFIDYNDALQAIQRDLSKSGGKGQKWENLMLLQDYVRYLLLEHTLERNLNMVDDLERNLSFDPLVVPGDGGSSGGSGSGSSSSSKPIDLVRLCDRMLQTVSELSSLSTLAALTPVVDLLNARSSGYKALRCYYLAMLHQTTSKLSNAALLYDQSADHAGVAISHLESADPQSTSVTKSLNSSEQVSVELAKLQALRGKIRAVRCALQAHAFIGEQGALPSASERVALLERLETYNDGGDDFRLIDVPPKMEAAPCKPVVFDLASEGLEFPDLKDRTRPPKKEGGWFGGWW